MAERRRPSRRGLLAAGTAAVVLVAAGGVAAYAANRSGAPAYRTATVGTASVSQTLHATGTVQPATSATLSFPVAGTVASLLVAPGDTVTAGQRLAALDTTALTSALARAQAAVADAALTLEQARNGQLTSGGQSGGTSNSRSSGGTAADPAATKAVEAAQRQVMADQRQLDRLLTTVKADLAAATTACATTPNPTQTDPAGRSGRPNEPTGPPTNPTPTPTPTPTAPGGTPEPAACLAAQRTVLTGETATYALERALAQHENTLDRALQHTSSSTTPSAGTPASTVPSATQLAAYQAAVDAAQAALAVSRQNLQQATLVSPIAGTVSTVGIAAGQQVAAGSSTAVIGIVGGDTHVITLAVDVTAIAQVKVGQPATVTPDGGTGPLAATVVSVGAAPSSTGGSSYPVRLGLAGHPAGLRDGVAAAVSLVTGQATGALTVPTSAVHHLGRQAYVLLLRDGTARNQPVTVGATGAVYTEITAGLVAGQQVVLADLSLPVPTSGTTTRFGNRAPTTLTTLR
jgi:RND family efflux transporter MFP subunit